MNTRISARQLSSMRSTHGPTTLSSHTSTSLRTMDSTGRNNNFLFSMSICRNSTWNTTTDDGRSTSVMCLAKGRGKAITETGIASMDLRRNVIRMSQFCDDQLHSKLLTQVHMIDPAEIVVAQTFKESSVLEEMFKALTRHFPLAKIQGVPRRYMNENKGKKFVKMLCSRDSSGVEVALHSKVYALLAISGLLNYVEETLSMYLAPHTIRMVYHSGANCMLMDHGTAVNLELLKCTANNGGNQTPQSLYSVINHTKTLTGALTLRAALLEPPTEKTLIEARYDAVEELTDDIDMFTSLQSALVKFPDIERVISLCIQIPRQESRCTAEAKIRNCLYLKTALDLVPCIREVLRPAKSPLLKSFRQKLMNEGLERILRIIKEKLNSHASVTSGVLSMKGQILFAVQTGLDGKLDAMREVYNSLIDQNEEMLQFLIETYHLSLKMTYTQQRGFHCTMKIPKNSEAPHLPEEFIKVTKNRGMCSMTTHKLVIHNSRITECMNSICDLSNRLVTQLLNDVHKEIPCLNALVNAIGHLDMISGFAAISRHRDYTRPELGELLAIKRAKHPVGDVTCGREVVPNNIYLTPESNFMIITGANNSGKSFYLRTIALLQVMAQIGCFVPASFAMIRICDQLFSRIGSDSSLTNLESPFTIEMKEIAFVLKHKTPNALIVLDELCRGTSTTEAIDLRFTICQQLLKMSAYTLFATHYKELCQLETTHCNCSNFCFITKYEDIETGSTAQKIVNDHKLHEGIAKGTRHGLRLAATMNFPRRVISNAYAIADKLEGVTAKASGSASLSLTSSTKDELNSLVKKIYNEIALIARYGGCHDEQVSLLAELQNKYRDMFRTLSAKQASAQEVDKQHGGALGKLVLAQNNSKCSNRHLSNPSTSLTTTTDDTEAKKPSEEVDPMDNESTEQLPRSNRQSHRSYTTTAKLVDYSMSPIELAGSMVENLHSDIVSPSRQSPRSYTTTAKLVDYSMSPIELAGSMVDNLHSDIVSPSSHIYRASTRKSIAQSPLRSLGESESRKMSSLDESTVTNNFFIQSNDDEDSFRKIFHPSSTGSSLRNHQLDESLKFSSDQQFSFASRKNKHLNLFNNSCGSVFSFGLQSSVQDGLFAFGEESINVSCEKGSMSSGGGTELSELQLSELQSARLSSSVSTRSPTTYLGLPHFINSSSSGAHNSHTSANSLRALSTSELRVESNGTSQSLLEVKQKSSDGGNLSSESGNTSHHIIADFSDQRANPSSVCSIVEEKSAENAQQNLDMDLPDITSISPILDTHCDFPNMADVTENDLVMEDSPGAKTGPNVLSSTRFSSVAQPADTVDVLNKTMSEKLQLADKTHAAFIHSVNSTHSLPQIAFADPPTGNVTGSSLPSSSLSHEPVLDDTVIAGGPGVVNSANESELRSANQSKTKSVTFGVDEIIPLKVFGRVKRRSMTNGGSSGKVRKRHSILSTSTSSDRLTNQQAASGSLPSGSRNMALLDDLLNASQSSQSQKRKQAVGSLSCVKVEPK